MAAWEEFLEPAGDRVKRPKEKGADVGSAVTDKRDPEQTGKPEESNPDDGSARVVQKPSAPVVHSAQNTTSRSVVDQIKGFVGTNAKELGRKTVQLLRNVQDNVVPASDEIAAVGATAAEAGRRAVGLGTSTKPLGDVYRDRRSYERAENAEAAKDPVLRTAGQAASLFAPPVATMVTKGAGAARAAVGLGETIAHGVGASNAELTGDKKEIWEALKDAGLSAAIGIVPAAAGNLKTGKAAERARAQQVGQDVGAGADMTHQNRAVPDEAAAQTIVDLVDRRPALKAKLRGDRDELKAEAQNVINELSSKTAPVYKEFDKAGGLVPVSDVDTFLKGKIDELSQSYDQNQQLIRGYEQIREGLASTTAARAKAAGLAPGAKAKLSHQDLRDWVTGLLRQKQNTKGSMAETPGYIYKEELHKAADEFLRKRMDDVAEKNPGLGLTLHELRQTNRDLSAAIRIEDVVSNADKRAFQKRADFAKKVGQVAGLTAGMGGSIVGGAGGGVLGAMGGMAIGGAAPPIIQGASRLQTEIVGKLARAARNGDDTAQLVEQAIKSGVPQRVIRSIQTEAEAGRKQQSTDAPADGPAWTDFIE